MIKKTLNFIFVLSLLFTEFAQSNELKTSELRALASNGYYLALEDGSIFETNFWNSWTSWYWKAGERVHIEAAEAREGDFRLTNIDQKPENYIFAKKCPPRENLPYRHFIAEVAENGQWIRLDNGFFWYVRCNFIADHRPYVLNWKKGDEIVFDYEVMNLSN